MFYKEDSHKRKTTCKYMLQFEGLLFMSDLHHINVANNITTVNLMSVFHTS